MRLDERVHLLAVPRGVTELEREDRVEAGGAVRGRALRDQLGEGDEPRVGRHGAHEAEPRLRVRAVELPVRAPRGAGERLRPMQGEQGGRALPLPPCRAAAAEEVGHTCISSAGHLSPSTAHLSMKPAHRSRKASSTMSRFLCVKKSLHLGTTSYASARLALPMRHGTHV